MSGELHGITFRQLEVFVAIARLRTFGAAADILGISQPSVSRHVKALEQKCGPLFVRSTGRRLELSGKGHLLYRRAPDLLRSIDEVAAELQDADAGPSLIRVASADYLHGLLKGVMADFLSRYPEYSIELKTVTNEDEGLAALAHDRADLFYIAKLDRPDVPRGSIIGQVEIGLYAVPSLAQSLQSEETGKGLPTIMPRDGSIEGDFIGQILQSSGVRAQRVRAHAEYFETARALCLRGTGVALLFDESVRDDVASGRLVKLAQPVRNMIRCCFVRSSADRQRGVQLFRQEARRFLQDIADGL